MMRRMENWFMLVLIKFSLDVKKSIQNLLSIIVNLKLIKTGFILLIVVARVAILMQKHTVLCLSRCFREIIKNKVVSILDSIDLKIKNNIDINNNLLEQVLAIYRHRFVDTTNELRQICRADEYFDISIGKTPPRKEPQWFSTNPKDVTWVSISDMGTCGLYISESSEQLTKEAVDRHNVKIVPDNTVLLSFKLTVGRIAITDGEMTTNEAIAHFKTDKKKSMNTYIAI